MDQADKKPNDFTQKGLYRPHGLSEIFREFGDIRAYIRTDGTISPDWERLYLSSAVLPAPLPLSWEPTRRISTVRCHRRLVLRFEAVFQVLHDKGLWSAIHNYGGCYAFRAQRGSEARLSLHAWGLAVDLNTITNPRGFPGDMSPDVVRTFEDAGFVWGRHFSVPDPQHFQFADGY